MKEKLEMLTNIAFIATALLIGVIAIKTTMYPANKNNELEPRIGSQLPNPPGYEWKAHDQTLALVLKKNCPYCEKSMPFYRTLVELKRANKISAHIISMFSDSPSDAKEVMNKENVGVDVIGDVQWPNYRVTGTPTIILADKQGKVVKSWIGQLPKDAENEVVQTLSASAQ